MYSVLRQMGSHGGVQVHMRGAVGYMGGVLRHMWGTWVEYWGTCGYMEGVLID